MSIFNFITTNFLNGLIAIILLIIGFECFNLSTLGANFVKILNKDKITNGGLVIAVFLFGLALVIAVAAN